MANRRKTFIVLVSILVAVVVAAILLVSVLANPDRYRPEVISFLETKTGKKIELSRIQARWIPLTIRLYGFGVANPEPFPQGYFFKADRVDAAIDWTALLHRQIVIKSVDVYNPTINVISDPDGLWNFENPPSKTGKSQNIFGFGPIPRMTISGGQLFGSSLIDPSDRPGPIVLEIHNLDATLKNVDFSAFTGPDSSALGAGDFNADSLRFGSIVVTKIKAKVRLAAKQVSFEGVSVRADRGLATGDLSFNLAGKSARFQTDLRLRDIDVTQLIRQFTGARAEMTGTMDGQVAFRGYIEHTTTPLASVRGEGKFLVRDGELPFLNSSDSLKQMARFRDPSAANRGPSAFSAFSSDLEVANQRMSSHHVEVAFYGVDLECAGYLNLDGEDGMDYQGAVKILKKQGFFTNVFARAFHEAKEQNGKLVFPIRITGTLAKPKVTAME